MYFCSPKRIKSFGTTILHSSFFHIVSVWTAGFFLLVSIGCAAVEDTEQRAIAEAEQAAEALEEGEIGIERAEAKETKWLTDNALIPWQIAVGLLVCTGLFFWGTSVVRHRKQQRIILAQEQQLQAQKEAIELQQRRHKEELLDMTDKIVEQARGNARRLGGFLGEVNRLAARYPTPPKEWNTYTAMKHDVVPIFAELIGKLEQIGTLSEREITYCVYSILYHDKTQTELAALIYYAPSGIRTFKLRVAKKLGTTATALYNTLTRLAIGIG